jgi:hypothetical protein
VFDDFFEFFKSRKETKNALLYIKSGLPVAYDKQSGKEYKAAMRSAAGFKEFILHEHYKIDNAINMDW